MSRLAELLSKLTPTAHTTVFELDWTKEECNYSITTPRHKSRDNYIQQGRQVFRMTPDWGCADVLIVDIIVTSSRYNYLTGLLWVEVYSSVVSRLSGASKLKSKDDAWTRRYQIARADCISVTEALASKVSTPNKVVT